jgi:acetolactate synthase-1/2/3 large subunit
MTLHQTIEADAELMTGAEIVVRALVDQGVNTLFGYPGGAVLPIYDALFHEPRLRHVLVRHEQGATHAAEGYARSTGKPGVVLVTSGPGATNAVTGIVDALMDSIPLVVITGQVPTHLIGSDAFQECDTVGITRSCTKHNVLVTDANDLARALHEAFISRPPAAPARWWSTFPRMCSSPRPATAARRLPRSGVTTPHAPTAIRRRSPPRSSCSPAPSGR